MIPIIYKNKTIGYGEIDLYLNNKQNKDIIIELKAISNTIGLKEKTQLITYKKYKFRNYRFNYKFSSTWF